ncbi:hypothetical protein [Pseudoclavibacter sp. AY1H1]|uniref:hypothetical protein n=1 Tax=Pseudoclavibacter sp. AY1H1 TaxID=2080584 RepID=UPI0015E469A6|nr:hypothetical protein [Pseudoclavibacter sp. AY1H1]
MLSTIRTRIRTITRAPEQGASAVEWIFIVVGALVIAGIVIAAITAFVQGQIAELPG